MGNVHKYQYSKIQFIMIDTDSVMMALSDEMENIVLTEKRDQWSVFKKKWFSTHTGCKIPGLLKMSTYIF